MSLSTMKGQTHVQTCAYILKQVTMVDNKKLGADCFGFCLEPPFARCFHSTLFSLSRFSWFSFSFPEHEIGMFLFTPGET